MKLYLPTPLQIHANADLIVVQYMITIYLTLKSLLSNLQRLLVSINRNTNVNNSTVTKQKCTHL